MPELVHVPPVATVTVPAKVTLQRLLEQMFCGGPASTVGAGVKVTHMVSLTGLQFPFPVVVSTKQTLLLVKSFAPGV